MALEISGPNVTLVDEQLIDLDYLGVDPKVAHVVSDLGLQAGDAPRQMRLLSVTEGPEQHRATLVLDASAGGIALLTDETIIADDAVIARLEGWPDDWAV